MTIAAAAAPRPPPISRRLGCGCGDAAPLAPTRRRQPAGSAGSFRKEAAGRSSLRLARGGRGPGARRRDPRGGSGRFIGRILQEPGEPLGQDLSRPVHEHPGVARARAQGLGDLVERVSQAFQLERTALGDRQPPSSTATASSSSRWAASSWGSHARLSASDGVLGRLARVLRPPGSACGGPDSSCRYMRS